MYTYSLHVFGSPFEHRKTSIGEGEQKGQCADPGEMKKRKDEYLLIE